MDGKPQLLDKHLITTCKKISFEDRSMIMLLHKNMKSGDPIADDAVRSSSTGAESLTSKSIRAFYTPAKLSETKDRKSTRLNSSHLDLSRMPSSA